MAHISTGTCGKAADYLYIASTTYLRLNPRDLHTYYLVLCRYRHLKTGTGIFLSAWAIEGSTGPSTRSRCLLPTCTCTPLIRYAQPPVLLSRDGLLLYIERVFNDENVIFGHSFWFAKLLIVSRKHLR